MPDGWLEQLAGTLVAAFHLEIRPATEDAQGDLAYVRKHFEGMRLVGSSPQEGAARVWGTFKLHRDGFGRFMIMNLAPLPTGRAETAFLEVRESNTAAQALYRALGFTSVGRRRSYYRAPREDALVLAAALPIAGGDHDETDSVDSRAGNPFT